MRGKTSLLRRWLSGAVYIQRKRSEAFLPDHRKRSERSPPPTTASAVSGHCPNDLVSLDSEFGPLNPAKPRSGPGPHVLATWVRKVSSAPRR